MADPTQTSEERNRTDGDAETFEQHASKGPSGILGEFWHFLRDNKKWWLTPIIIVLLLVALLIILGGSAAAPFIYTLF
jgi:hypothetical protein